MDTELLRTFLEINRTRHFGRAANNLYLTQSAVSARMRLLEQAVGLPLLTRSRNDIQLTPSGRKLLPHAEAIVARWTQAQQEVALHDEEKSALHIGAQLTIAELLFPKWTSVLWEQAPDLALHAEMLSTKAVVPRLQERTIDLVVTYGPTADPAFKDVQLGSIDLCLMTTNADDTVELIMNGANYVHVEWGTWFDVQFAKTFPNRTPGGLRTGSIHLVLALLESKDGACFLPVNIAEQSRAPSLQIYRVADSPTFEQDIYASYPLDSPQRGVIEEALNVLSEAGVIQPY